jgi:hypothetical protein
LKEQHLLLSFVVMARTEQRAMQRKQELQEIVEALLSAEAQEN